MNEALREIRAAPITVSLNRFITKPPVMMPRATAGRLNTPGRDQKPAGIDLSCLDTRCFVSFVFVSYMIVMCVWACVRGRGLS